MIKRAKPIFWAFMVYTVYALFQLIVLLILGPYSVIAKLLLGILGLLLCVLFVVFFMILIRRPSIPNTNILLSFVPYPMGLMGLTQICFGSLALYSLLDALPAVLKVADTPWKMYVSVGGAVQIPFGLLSFFFQCFN
jgi:hypothetical protein